MGPAPAARRRPGGGRPGRAARARGRGQPHHGRLGRPRRLASASPSRRRGPGGPASPWEHDLRSLPRVLRNPMCPGGQPWQTAEFLCDAGSIMTAGNCALLAKLAALLEPRGEILEAYLFGSKATGSAQPHSDVDVAAYLGEAMPVTSAFGYAADLATALMRGLQTSRVDVVILRT